MFSPVETRAPRSVARCKPKRRRHSWRGWPLLFIRIERDASSAIAVTDWPGL